MPSTSLDSPIAIMGAGPAGLMAAEVLSQAGLSVHLFDAMPSVGRKFLLAGLGGLNLTHAEPFEPFVSRFGSRREACARWLASFDNQAICEWAQGLGIETFVGSSQRIFPKDMKAAPLLRAWLHRLRHPNPGTPVTFHMRHRWNGQIHRTTADAWRLSFDSPTGAVEFEARGVLLALGGASWPRLGSDGAWQAWLGALGVPVAPLRPSNCGFDVKNGWSEFFSTRFAGAALKSVSIDFTSSRGEHFQRKGEFVITQTGIEGSLIYAASSLLRDEIERHDQATLTLNLRPDWSQERITQEVAHPRGRKSLSSHLQSRLNLNTLHTTLLHELLSHEVLNQPEQLAYAITHLPITLSAPSPIEQAISCAGGIELEGLTDGLMLKHHPGVFVAGEMLDWEAPTGGYLLSACMASARVAAQSLKAYIQDEGTSA